MRLAYPYLLLLLPLLYALMRRGAAGQAAVLHPSAELLKTLPPSLRLRLRAPVLRTLGAAFVLLLCIGAARPQRLLPRSAPRPGRDIMLVLDTSASMGTRDFELRGRQVSRLEAVKTLAGDFAAARRGDRIGLVVFGTQPYLESPLTSAPDALQKAALGGAGDKTALGDALALGLKRLQAAGAGEKALILLTDGVNTAGRVAPLKAAEAAQALNIKVHTIGVGRPRRALEPARRQEGYDEETLKEIAALSGGVYFNAADSEGLSAVYRAIDALERTSGRDPGVILTEELYPHCAWAALAALLLYLLLSYTCFLKVP